MKTPKKPRLESVNKDTENRAKKRKELTALLKSVN
jgi:hypothetical protein